MRIFIPMLASLALVLLGPLKAQAAPLAPGDAFQIEFCDIGVQDCSPDAGFSVNWSGMVTAGALVTPSRPGVASFMAAYPDLDTDCAADPDICLFDDVADPGFGIGELEPDFFTMASVGIASGGYSMTLGSGDGTLGEWTIRSGTTFGGPVLTRGIYRMTIKENAVPEPTTTALLALGLLGAGYVRRRRAH